jgi:broad specificity phosphatase PhoE
MRIFLLRHGESKDNVKNLFSGRLGDPELSEQGEKQAAMQAKKLSSHAIEGLYCSPKVRARQTARLVSERLELTPMIHEQLLEVDLGDLEGKSTEDSRLWAKRQQVMDHWSQKMKDKGYPGGETLEEIGNRFGGLLDEIQEHSFNKMILVGHKILFMASMWLFCENRGNHINDLQMEPAHLTVIEGAGKTFRIVAFNISPEDSLPRLSE